MSDTTPDLTGVDPTYAVTNDQYRIFMVGQRIDFKTPIYQNSLVITILGTSTTLVFGTDWTVAVADYTAMGQAMAVSSVFTATLISSIQIITAFTTPYTISCNYQLLYKDVIANILSRLAVIETKLSILTTTTTSTPAIPKLLPADPNETNTSNLIVAEPYTTNTFSGMNLIIPVSGAFFADSVVLTISGTTPPVPLVRNVDYIIIGCDIERTRSTTNTSGVYRSILVTRPFAGIISVTYHAYGGGVTLSDVSSIYQTLVNINAYLGANTFLTAADLGTDAAFTGVISRLVAIEAKLVTL